MSRTLPTLDDAQLRGQDLNKAVEKYQRLKGEAKKQQLAAVLGSIKGLVVRTSYGVIMAAGFGHEHREDIFQAGFAGAIVAASKYEISKGFAFTTYAQFWIRAYAQVALQRCIGLGLGSSTTFRAHKAVRDRRQAFFKRFPISPLHLDAEIGTSTTTVGEVIKDPNSALGYTEVDDNEQLAALFEEAQLDNRERYIMLMWASGMKLALIAEELGLSRQRVKQIRDAALVRLQQAAQSKEY
jgi:RNA polymerase primary sigma factor